MGFIIATTVIVIYVIMITKSVYVARTAKDDIGRIYCNWYKSEF